MNACPLTDTDTATWLRVSTRTLRRLLADSDAAGIAVPAVGAGRGRRWLGYDAARR